MTDASTGERPEPTTERPDRPESQRSGGDRPPSDTTNTTKADGGPSGTEAAAAGASTTGGSGDGAGSGGAKRRRRGSRGGRNRNRKPGADGTPQGGSDPDARSGGASSPTGDGGTERAAPGPTEPARKPQIGDSRHAPAATATGGTQEGGSKDRGQDGGSSSGKKRRRRGGRGRGGGGGGGQQGGQGQNRQSQSNNQNQNQGKGQGRQRQGRGGGKPVEPVTAITDADPVDLDDETLEKRRGKERKGRPVGRYLMAVHVQPSATQISVLEGRSLIEHYVSRPADEITQIHGNVYLGKVQNVLPSMEAAFVDIGTPKNAVLYRSDTRIDPDDVDHKAKDLRIEQILKPRQTIVCQVTKNPIGAKGARLTQEISLPGRFVVLVPNSSTYGISKRLPDPERKRLRGILDKVKPKGHGLIVRTAAEGISAEELQADVARLAEQWNQIEALANSSKAPALLYRDPDLSIRVIREEFNQDYRQVVIDDAGVYEQVRDYVRSISPALVERVELYDPAAHGGLGIFETHHVHEQLHKALDRKVWLPSGGSLIIDRTEAMTTIDVNTGKNVGSSSLEETVTKNNLEAAEEVARQLRLRDIGGIIVIDFIDMEIKANREQVIATFRKALARDKTRTQVFDISELGLVQMTRKRIGEGLLESLSTNCPTCEGRGMVFDEDLIGS